MCPRGRVRLAGPPRRIGHTGRPAPRIRRGPPAPGGVLRTHFRVLIVVLSGASGFTAYKL
ncbi:hypothetical protein GCM10009549_07730 [Streptomyces thermoalcalitolerans]|uniref:Uncharacterized protein n=1 Tax=Streptomyces thermoalcalitolerans TaxID=65605 RepID=A0ABN1NEK3_9ACTN